MAAIATPLQQNWERIYSHRTQTASANVFCEDHLARREEESEKPRRDWLRRVDDYYAEWRRISAINPSESIRFRGAVSCHFDRVLLFSQEVNLTTASLPRWRPKVVLSRRDLEGDDA
jgi:hypothetical protein